MADFNNAVMTNGGAALLAATTAGTAKIKFTKLVTGSGTYSDSEKTRASLQARSTLKAQKQEIPFSKIEMATDTCVKLTAFRNCLSARWRNGAILIFWSTTRV